MTLDLLTVGEALVEVMRTDVGQPLDQPGPFTGPYPSGAPFIFAAQAARLGAKVGAIGTVGDDAFGRCQRLQLIADGIDDTGLHTSSTATTGVAFVAYNADGSRNFVFSLGAGGDLSPDRLSPAQFDGLRCLHLMGSTLSMSKIALETGKRALDLAIAAGARFSFDPNLRPELMSPERARAVFSPFMEAADVLIPTAEELVLLTDSDALDEAVDSLISAKPERIIVVTHGADGCTVYTQDGQTDVVGFLVEEVDPTGAGDCFDAGFLVRWLATDTPVEAARWANACGALAVSKRGPMAGAERLSVVVDFLTQHSNQ
jgi:sugar/nucleoside kinase (ribokinase family)